MAKLAGNSPLQGMHGLLGGLVFRSVHGKTIVSTQPSWPRSREQSERQRENRSRFADASRYAHKILRDPAMNEYYWKKAKKLALPNAYTAALTDYMRNTIVESVSTKHYTGKAGGKIIIVARKKNFTVGEVNVKIMTKTGQEIENGQAIKNASGEWIYKNIVQTTAQEGLTVIVRTKDHVGNETNAIQVLGKALSCSYHWKNATLHAAF